MTQAKWASEDHEVLGGAEPFIDRGVLAGEADELPHRVRVGDDTMAEDASAANVRAQQGRRQRDGGGPA